MADLRIVDAPVLLQESITDDVKMPTGGLGNFSVRLGDILWYVVAKENLASKSYVDNSSKGVQDKLDIHVSAKDNPHQVTKAQVGLGNVDNTADIDKPLSHATKSAITTATTDMATKTYVNSKDGDLTTLTTNDKTNLVRAINEVVSVKADKATTLVGYGISDAYTKSEIDTNYGGVKTLYDKNVQAGAGANGWTDLLIKLANGRTQREKNADFISVKDFGAKGDGITDDTAAIQAAINASLNVFFHAGQYPTTGIKLRTGSKLNGSGTDAVLIQKYDVNKYFGILQAQSENASIADNIKDITVTNLTLKGTVDVNGFNEHVHLVHFDGVSNVTISQCKFIGFRGDGVYIGSGTSGDMERHNTNVTIKDNFFDGVNNQNRNGISFIDVNGALVDNNTFVNTTKAGMPGAIDFEADPNPWHVLEDITITNNKILDVKAGIASIQVYLPATCPYVPRKITIANNYIKGVADTNGNDSTGSLGIYVNTNKTTDETITNHVINNNYVDTTHSPLSINGSNGGDVTGNTFANSTQAAKVGFANRVKNVRISGNKFNKIGKADNGLVARNISFVDIDNNKFIDCSTYGYAMINLDNGASSYLTINNNYFYNTSGTVTNALWVEGSHTLAPNTNKWFDNHYDNLGTNFKAEQSNQLYTAFTPKVFAMIGGTGTIAINSGNTNVVGTGTKFTTELVQGSQITVGNQNLTVASIQSDTQLTTTAAAKNTYSGAGYQYNASGTINYGVRSGYYRLNGKKISYQLKVVVTASPSGTLRVTLPKLANTNNIELPQTVVLYGITTTGTPIALINSGVAGLDGSSALNIYSVSQAGALSTISTTQNFTVIASGEYSIA